MPRSDFPGLPKKPQVPLVGEDGNAFAVLGRVAAALRDTGHPPALIHAYMEEAMSGDYNNLLRVTMDYVEEQGGQGCCCGGCGDGERLRIAIRRDRSYLLHDDDRSECEDDE